ncbi:MAG: hypothetical protein HQK89_13720 [Nitrospirae bacterium]|nr:hypothetical protein [Nitrospirota bacterium]
MNKENILKHIDVYTERLRQIAGYIRSSDRASLLREFDEARYLRKNIQFWSK